MVGANVSSPSFSEQESQAVYFLRLQNVARIDVVNYISHGISKYADQPEQQSRRAANTDETHNWPGSRRKPAQPVSTNLNEQATQGDLTL